MARLRSSLAAALALYLALLPLTGAAAAAPPPTDRGRPVGPPAAERSAFVPAGAPLTLRAFNGFSAVATPGLFRHHDHGHSGGLATYRSPWGEQLELRYWIGPHGLTLEYDGVLKVRYRFAAGVLQEIVAETGERRARMAVGNRAELALLGQTDIASFDLSAYRLIEEELRALHSAAFLDGLGRFAAPTEVSCTTQGIQCVACIIAWAGTVAGIAAGCLVGGVPTLGAACLAAILTHEATSFACAATCIAWYEDCARQASSQDADPLPDGCDPP